MGFVYGGVINYQVQEVTSLINMQDLNRGSRMTDSRSVPGDPVNYVEVDKTTDTGHCNTLQTIKEISGLRPVRL